MVLGQKPLEEKTTEATKVYDLKKKWLPENQGIQLYQLGISQ